ncbi:MAG: amidohydrolase [Clostridium sp.]|nr:amidohydrolase [Clostridium sp.]
MVIDSHEHIFSNIKSQIELMDKAGVEKTILFSTTFHPENARNLLEIESEMNKLTKILSGELKGEERLLRQKQSNEEVSEAVRNNPNRFMGFGAVPLDLNQNDTSEWINKYIVNSNLLGAGEFTPGNIDAVINLEKVFKALSDNPKYPMWIHTFDPVNLEKLKVIMNMCTKYPRVKVILGHLGGVNWRSVIEFAKDKPQIYLDLSAVYSTFQIKSAVWQVPERCLFSSDAPMNEPSIYRFMLEKTIDDKSILKGVLGENIQKALEL